MEETIDVKYNKYLGSIIKKLTDKDSFTETQENELTKMFDNFSFSNDEIGKVKAQTNSSQTEFINKYATAGAIELIKEENAQLLLDAQIAKINAEIQLTNAQKDKVDAEGDLVKEQILQAKEQTLLIGSQKALIDRQILGYGDNLLVKAGEFQGGLASFAVNSASDSAQAAIDAFQTTITTMKGRS